MKSSFLSILSIFLVISCDYTKQQREIVDLTRENINLKREIKSYKADSLFKSEEKRKDPHYLQAIKIIDSLKFNDPKTFKQIEKKIEASSYEREY